MTKKLDLTKLTGDELAVEYERIALLQEEDFLNSAIAAYNRLEKKRTAVVDELRSRNGDQRVILVRFVDHPNPFIRLMLSSDIFSLDEARSRRMVQRVADEEYPPYDFTAKMKISSWEMGMRPR
jgi:hypothetical protein